MSDLMRADVKGIFHILERGFNREPGIPYLEREFLISDVMIDDLVVVFSSMQQLFYYEARYSISFDFRRDLPFNPDMEYLSRNASLWQHIRTVSLSPRLFAPSALFAFLHLNLHLSLTRKTSRFVKTASNLSLFPFFALRETSRSFSTALVFTFAF